MLAIAKIKITAALVVSAAILTGGAAAAHSRDNSPTLPLFEAGDSPQVKEYPQLRVAISAGGDSEIKAKINEQPLLITLDPDDTAKDGLRLAATSTIVNSDTQLGWNGDVFVKELPAQRVLSLGYRGPVEKAELRKKIDVVWDQVTGREAKWSPVGPPRLVIYDDTSTAPEARRFEVQLPVVDRESARRSAKRRELKQPPEDAESAKRMKEALSTLASIVRSWKTDEAKLQQLTPPYQVRPDKQVDPAERLEERASRIEQVTFTGATLSLVSKLGDRRMFEPVATLLEHPRWVVRREAAFALGNLRDLRAVPALVKALEREKEWNTPYRDGVIAAIVYALGKLGDPRAIDPIRKTMLENMHDGAPQRDRYRALDGPYTYVSQIPFKLALAMLKDGEYLPVVRAYARDTVMGPSGGIEILMEMGDAQVYAILLEHLGNDSSSYRMMAIRELVELGDRRAIAAIKPLVKDQNEAVRAAAEWAVEKLGGSED